MKKILALLALVLGVVSCQTEPEGLDVNVGGEQEVMLTVSLPETTRANSANGFDLSTLATTDYSLRYILEIYRVEDEQVLYNTCQRFVETSDNTSMVFPVRLAQDYNYRIVAWTDIVEGNSKEDRYYYTEAGLDEIAIRDNGTVNWNAMDETRDAYTCVKVVNNFTSASNLDMTLTRPFAKVRVVATDIEDIRKVGLEPKSATVVYAQDMFFKYNAVAETYAHTDSKSHNISYPATPVYEDATGEMTLFADYIFVPSTGTAKFTLNVKDQKDHSIKSNNFNTEIFVERNKLTTIKGDVLTVGGNVEVKIENELGELETINYADSAETLQEIINAAPADGEQTNITLGGNIDLSDLLNAGILATRAEKQYGLEVPAGKSVVLDLNGYTISQSKECTDSYSMILNNGELIITGNGTIEFTNAAEGGSSDWGTYTIENRGEGVLTIDNVTIRHNGCVNGETNRDTNIAIQNYQGKVVIDGGTIASTQFRSLRDFTAGGEIIINGGTFLGQVWMQGLGNGPSSLTINGGNFSPVVGYDGSSVYITNSSNIVNVAVNGGMFNTKIGCYDATKEGAKGCIVAGKFTAAAKENTNAALINDDYQFVEDNDNDLWTLERKADVAKIGEVGYTSLAKAVAAVQDGDTITLVADEKFTEKNYYDNGGWKDGLGYAGDKSFTIDLGGKTVSQNGALNDYLIWIKNVGSKANTITIKNGTLDAGTSAFCALCTASSHDNPLTINLENITLINKNSNGSTVKVRAGSVVNVKAGTKIIGNDSYLGIENWKATVNIYDGAEIYMNGTSSYNGCLVGVGGNGTINVYGGYGKGVKGGFIAMTSGGTINVAGGEWIANTNGSIGNNSNLYVLTAQSNKYESGFAGPSIINVTGGTLRGGMDAWVLNNLEGEKAELNISGGNFNANPTNFLAEGCEAKEANGIWTVRVLPVAKIGETEYETLEAAAEAAEANDTITLTRDVTLSAELTLPAGITLNGNGKQINGTIYAGGNLTFAGHTKVTSFSASYYDRVITIGEGACLEVTGGGRVTLGYRNTFNITGSLEDAKTADKTNVQPSLIIPGGISITGGSDATMNVTNAYVKIGNTSSKNSAANGKFTLNFNNSIAEFTNQFTFAEPTSGMNPTFNLNIVNSVLTTATKLCIAAPGCNTVIDNSNVTMATYFRNSGKAEIKNGSVVTGSTIQFGENGGHDGETTVNASTLTINASSNGHALDGKGTGSLTLENGATATVTYYKGMTIEVDATSTFTGTEVK